MATRLVMSFTPISNLLGWLVANVRVENRLVAAVQSCAPPLLGWIPDELTGCPSAAVDRLGAQLGLASDDVSAMLARYGGWEGRTRRDHRALVLAGVLRRAVSPRRTVGNRVIMLGRPFDRRSTRRETEQALIRSTTLPRSGGAVLSALALVRTP